MPAQEVSDFKIKFQKFMKWLPYMTKKRLAIEDPDSKSWLSIVKDFNTKIADPFDAAWALLSNSERKIFEIIDTKGHKHTIFEKAPF